MRNTFLKLILVAFVNGQVMTGCNSSGTQASFKDSAAVNGAAVNGAALPDANGFRDSIDGRTTDLYVIKNSNGMQAAFTNYGARLVSLLVPDKERKLTDVVVGFGSVKEYVQSTEPYFGATIGRYGNRIAKGRFILDGKTYNLFTNNGPNTLHGGKKGFQAVVWDAGQLNDSTITFNYLSHDGEEGFPGNLRVKLTCRLTSNNELLFDYEATTDQRTVVNLTNHAFFNLNGEGSGTILDHDLQINGKEYTPVDSTLIPFGSIDPVAGTPFDFSKPQKIGARIEQPDAQLKHGKGYDHNYVLEGAGMKHAAVVTGDKSGIRMDVYTEEPGLQFYSGNFMAGMNMFKNGTKDEFRTAFCLETQHFPDSPNQPAFPSTVLEPGRLYKTHSSYRFSTRLEK